jgi:hypothetical protein
VFVGVGVNDCTTERTGQTEVVVAIFIFNNEHGVSGKRKCIAQLRVHVLSDVTLNKRGDLCLRSIFLSIGLRRFVILCMRDTRS